MLPVNKFRKMFMYILMDYCEDTCTIQDEIYSVILIEPEIDPLIVLFAEEGFMEWFPDSFPCVSLAEDSLTYTNIYDPEDSRSFPCYEQYWKTLCDNHDVDFDLFLASL
jgi:hypothetical protein